MRVGSVVLVVAAAVFDFRMCITASTAEREQIFSRQVMKKPYYLPSYREIISLIQLVKNKSRQKHTFSKADIYRHLDQDGFVYLEYLKDTQGGTGRHKDEGIGSNSPPLSYSITGVS